MSAYISCTFMSWDFINTLTNTMLILKNLLILKIWLFKPISEVIGTRDKISVILNLVIFKWYYFLYCLELFYEKSVKKYLFERLLLSSLLICQQFWHDLYLIFFTKILFTSFCRLLFPPFLLLLPILHYLNYT